MLKELNQQDLSHHDHRCELCDRAIDEKYTTCNVCHEALNISDALSSHHNMTASFVFSDEDNDKESINF